MPRRPFRGNSFVICRGRKNKADHQFKTYSFRCKRSIHALFGKYTIPESGQTGQTGQKRQTEQTEKTGQTGETGPIGQSRLSR